MGKTSGQKTIQYSVKNKIQPILFWQSFKSNNTSSSNTVLQSYTMYVPICQGQMGQYAIFTSKKKIRPHIKRYVYIHIMYQKLEVNMQIVGETYLKQKQSVMPFHSFLIKSVFFGLHTYIIRSSYIAIISYICVEQKCTLLRSLWSDSLFVRE